MVHVAHEEAAAAVVDGLRTLLGVAAELTDEDLLAASRCRGWAVGDVLVHVHLGLQEAVLGVLARTDAAPDTDAASYWRGEVPTNDDEADDDAG